MADWEFAEEVERVGGERRVEVRGSGWMNGGND